MKIEIRKSFWLESSRSLPFLPKEHPCHRLHGHSFELSFVLEGELTDHWLMDYHSIDGATAELRAKLDHQNLNEVIDNPTTEKLAIWIYDQAKKNIPILKQVILSETRNTECRYPVV